MIKNVENMDDFKKELKDAGDKLVVVDFTATWCGPCKMIGPYFGQLSENPEFSNVVFLKVDVDEADDVSVFCGIKCMPTFQFFRKGERVEEFSGSNQDKLLELLRNLK
ncbi:Thioredoxin [Scophthalmus maximus]|uniref:Thioredoxin n=1 Tax=Scophthalmus maximus TaxID=52904 RepID=A0A2U9B178_SCOMX|nr:thioredoxin [Scophthalmus maximus]AWO97531.1 Thioredoxin [Scophthalmus maximus]